MKGIKWRLQFKSFNEDGCLVNIYEEGYVSNADLSKTGANVPFDVETGVTALQGASVPFEMQEKANLDMLSFIRTKTGYLRIVDTDGNASALYSTNPMQHFVEVFYGANRIFTGYIQCQSFHQSYTDYNRELEFPLLSPLELMDSKTFAVPTDLDVVTLGSLLYEVMNVLNPYDASTMPCGYQQVIYPRGGYAPWNNLIYPTVFCPFDKDFDYYPPPTGETVSVYKPRTFADFINGICACFGWMVHDCPDGLLFSEYRSGDTASYSSLPIGNLSVASSGRSDVNSVDANLLDTYTESDTDTQIDCVLPAKKITINVNGNGDNDKLTVKYAKTEQVTSSFNYGPVESSCWLGWSLKPYDPTVDGKNKGIAEFTSGAASNGDVSNFGLFPLSYNSYRTDAYSVALEQFWLCHYSASWPMDTTIISKTFYENIPIDYDGGLLLKLQVQMSVSLRAFDLHLRETYLWLTVTMGDTQLVSRFVHFNTDGTLNPDSKHVLSQYYNKYADNVDGILITGIRGAGATNMTEPITVRLSSYANGNLFDQAFIKIKQIELTDKIASSVDYYRAYNREGDKIERTGNGLEERSIDLTMHNYSVACATKNVFCPPGYGALTGSPPTFSYMFQPQYFLTIKMRITNTASFALCVKNGYIRRWSYNGSYWLIIACEVFARDSEVQLTLLRL